MAQNDDPRSEANRRRRLAEELRANLHRRKAQARARTALADDTTGDGRVSDTDTDDSAG